MKRDEPVPALTDQEVDALQEFARRHGRSWKRILNYAWIGEAPRRWSNPAQVAQHAWSDLA